MIAELGVVLAILGLSLFTRTGDMHFECYQVNPETQQTSVLGRILMTRKHRKVTAQFQDWGPDHVTRDAKFVMAMPDERTPLGIKILDTPAGVHGHSYVLWRRHGMTRKFKLSEGVAERDDTSYCMRMSAHAFRAKQEAAEIGSEAPSSSAN